MKQITWWKLLVAQIMGVVIMFLIPFLGIDRLIILLLGNHTSMGNVLPMMMIIFPVFVGLERKINGWWIPLLFVMIPLCIGVIKIIPLCFDKFWGYV